MSEQDKCHYNIHCKSCHKKDGVYCKLYDFVLNDKNKKVIDNCAKLWENPFWELMDMLRGFSVLPCDLIGLENRIKPHLDEGETVDNIDNSELAEYVQEAVADIIVDNLTEQYAHLKEEVDSFMNERVTGH